MGDSRVPKHAELLLRAQRAKQQEWHAPETDPARITRAGGTVPIKTHGGGRSWVLIYKLGVAKMPNHACSVPCLGAILVAGNRGVPSGAVPKPAKEEQGVFVARVRGVDVVLADRRRVRRPPANEAYLHHILGDDPRA